jgi:hypothetical protein
MAINILAAASIGLNLRKRVNDFATIPCVPLYPTVPIERGVIVQRFFDVNPP